MAICSTYDPDCYGCRLRAKDTAISTAATPNRVANRPHVMRPMVDPSYEKGYVTESRPGGTVMPILAPGSTRPMRVQERADLGHSKVDEGLRRLRNDPNVFQPA